MLLCKCLKSEVCRSFLALSLLLYSNRTKWKSNIDHMAAKVVAVHNKVHVSHKNKEHKENCTNFSEEIIWPVISQHFDDTVTQKKWFASRLWIQVEGGIDAITTFLDWFTEWVLLHCKQRWSHGKFGRIQISVKLSVPIASFFPAPLKLQKCEWSRRRTFNVMDKSRTKIDPLISVCKFQ